MNKSAVQPTNLFMDDEINFLHAELCNALSDPKRILILYALSGKHLNVTELTEQVGINQPTTSRHLKILRDTGIVYPIRNGQKVEYHITDSRLVEALNLLRQVLHVRLERRAKLVKQEQENENGIT